uniref:Uncharacterized protein n=1 Tax=Candidatus Kentrum sp. FM TaxID=2126340 RepID=A0A450SRB0_9GAMM|nr:MAG: hypothetical protein BECKFM1743C_GA0114222_100212 [Candidatus Kentron sp. FM]VFJ56455.1 MAG: hypothetical protein BECKFM1743A_GA0114220_101682 [Candidatus Kentron sp. FM]
MSPQILENIASYPRFPSLRTLKVISVKEHTSLLVLLPSFCVAMTVTSGLSARHCALNLNKGFR